jgi:predicted transcriptional regulator
LAQEFKRRLWSTIVKGVSLPPFKVDQYLNTITVVFYGTIEPEKVYQILGCEGEEFRRRKIGDETLDIFLSVEKLPCATCSAIARELNLPTEFVANVLEELQKKKLVSCHRARWKLTNLGRHVLQQIESKAFTLNKACN